MVLLFLITSSYLGNNAFAQTTWETFKEKDGLYSLQIPSNWIPQKVLEQDKIAPIQGNFVYFPEDEDSFAWLDVMANVSLYYDPADFLQGITSYYQSSEDYKLLEPSECLRYMLNKIQACSIVQSLRIGDEKPRNILDIYTIDSNEIGYLVTYVASEDLYDKFLPVAKYMISTLTFDTDKVASTLGIEPSGSSASNQQQLSPSSNNNSSNATIIPDSELPEIPTN